MTEKPARTMTLTPYEWRALVATGANNLYSFVGAMTEPVPNREHLLWFNDALDRLKMQVSAWAASGQPAQPAEYSGLAPIKTEGKTWEEPALNGRGVTAAPASPKKKRRLNEDPRSPGQALLYNGSPPE